MHKIFLKVKFLTFPDYHPGLEALVNGDDVETQWKIFSFVAAAG
jgi:hypothetical protein